MEKLKMQDRGSVKVYDVEINDKLDTDYKAGLYLQTKAFLEGDISEMIDIEGQVRNAKIYALMESNSHAVYKDGAWVKLN